MDPDNLKMVSYAPDGRMPPVGSILDGASPYGVLDMAGSAFEWVSDWYSSSYYADSPMINPGGPTTGKYHVLRGGWFEWSIGNYSTMRVDITYRSTFRSGNGSHGRQLFGRHNLSSAYEPGAGVRCANDGP